MRVDGLDKDSKSLAFDNMAYPVDRSVAGTTNWNQYEIVLDVPEEASVICFGFLLSGTGALWGDDLAFELLDDAPSRGGLTPEDDLPIPAPWPSVRALPAQPRTRQNAGLPDAASTVTAARMPLRWSEGGGPFFGRVDEQRRFKELLAELVKAPKKSDLGWSPVMLVYGIGGIGKSRLSEHLLSTARREGSLSEYADKFAVVTIDWETVRTRVGAEFAAHPGPSFEAVLEELYQGFCRQGKLARHFDDFLRLQNRRSAVIAKVDTMSAQYAQQAPSGAGFVGRSAKILASLLKAGQVVGVPPVLGELAADELPGLLDEAMSWLRSRLDPDDFQLFVRPHDALASAFASGLRAAATRRPLILHLDTYEIVASVGPWLRVIMAQSGPRVAWMMCGRLDGDHPGWANEPDSYRIETPRRGISELGAYRKEVPPERLRLLELGAFDVKTLRDYVSWAAPQCPINEKQLDQLFTATAGIPLAVRMAAFLLGCGVPIRAITDDVPLRRDYQAVVTGMTGRFLIHLREDDTLRPDLERIYGLALAAHPNDPHLIGALWDSEHVVEAFESLAQVHDFVLTGPFRLHETVRAFLQRYLVDPFEREQVREPNQRAVALLEHRLVDHHQRLITLEQRTGDDAWIRDTIALTWHRFWVENRAGWATLMAAFPAAVAYNPSFGRALLDLASHFVTSSTPNELHRLGVLRDAVGPIATLFDRMGSEALDELARSNRRLGVEPDSGCGDERMAILAWLNGQHALQNRDHAEALRYLTLGADCVPSSTMRLRRWISRSLVTLSRRFISSDRSAISADLKAALPVADLAILVEPDSVEAHLCRAGVLDALARFQEALNAYERVIELDPANAKAHDNRGHMLYELGRLEEALLAFQHAIDLNQPDVGPHATVNLGVVLYQEHDPDGACQAFQRAIDTNHRDYAPQAAWSLGAVLAEQGDVKGACAAYQIAIDSGHQEYCLKATSALSSLLAEHGEPKGHLGAAELAAQLEPDSVEGPPPPSAHSP
jgi:tetratricopeptide (TPR) repeat protein